MRLFSSSAAFPKQKLMGCRCSSSSLRQVLIVLLSLRGASPEEWLVTHDCGGSAGSANLPPDDLGRQALLLRNCLLPVVRSGLLPISGWPDLVSRTHGSQQDLRVPTQTVRRRRHPQREERNQDPPTAGFGYLDKTRPWAGLRLDVMKKKTNDTGLFSEGGNGGSNQSEEEEEEEEERNERSLSFEELLLSFQTGRTADGNDVVSSYVTWRLPQSLRQLLAPVVAELAARVPLPRSLAGPLLAETGGYNLWLASSGVSSSSSSSFAEPHYDLERNLILQLHGNKTYLVAPPSEYFATTSSSTASSSSSSSSSSSQWSWPPLHPSSHPRWRHLRMDMEGSDGDSSDFFHEPPFLPTSSSSSSSFAAAHLGPGDALFLPPFFFHATAPPGPCESEREGQKSGGEGGAGESSLFTASVNVWFGSAQQELEQRLRAVRLPLSAGSTKEDTAALVKAVVDRLDRQPGKESEPRRPTRQQRRPSTTSLQRYDYSIGKELQRRCRGLGFPSTCSSSGQGFAEEATSADALQRALEDPYGDWEEAAEVIAALLRSDEEEQQEGGSMAARRTIMGADYAEELLDLADRFMPPAVTACTAEKKRRRQQPETCEGTREKGGDGDGSSSDEPAWCWSCGAVSALFSD